MGCVGNRKVSAGRVCAVLTASVLMGAIVGCSAPRRVAKSPPEKPNPVVPRSVESVGIKAIWREPAPDGTARPVLEVNAATGKLDAESQSGTIQEANGRFYRDGVAKAAFTAPVVKADQSRGRVVAYQGVRVTSLDPPGTTVTASRITWYTAKNLIVAEGNVYFSHRAGLGAEETVRGGPIQRVTIDTALKTLRIP